MVDEEEVEVEFDVDVDVVRVYLAECTESIDFEDEFFAIITLPQKPRFGLGSNAGVGPTQSTVNERAS